MDHGVEGLDHRQSQLPSYPHALDPHRTDSMGMDQVRLLSFDEAHLALRGENGEPVSRVASQTPGPAAENVLHMRIVLGLLPRGDDEDFVPHLEEGPPCVLDRIHDAIHRREIRVREDCNSHSLPTKRRSFSRTPSGFLASILNIGTFDGPPRS